MLVGIAAADDYGVHGDVIDQRAIGEANLRHLAGEPGLNLLWPPWNRLYGPVFEAPLAMVERILGRDDGRRVYLSRYLLTHLLFIAAGFAGYLLTWRLFGSRWLALFALLLFLLHPRIYAHAFFNSKDVPFLGLFMICLWLAHRAFARGAETGAAGAFALCGVAAGLLTNQRIMGLAFIAGVVFMRVCDVAATAGRDERRRVIASGAIFAFASVATFYATMPYLWADPLARFAESLAVLSAHPTDPLLVFQGKFVHATDVPPSYLPVWFGITTPLLALLLGVVGFANLAWRVASRLRRPPAGDLLRDTPLRFELLVAACFVVPMLATIALRPTQYDDWRHSYFLWAPFVLLAAVGLRALAEGASSACQRFLRRRAAVAAVAGLAALGLGATAVEMTRLHPHQHLYFNALANRPAAATPLHQRFHISDVFRQEHGYAHILEELADREEPADAVFNVRRRGSTRNLSEPARLGIVVSNIDLEMFRQHDRRRFKFDPNADPDFTVSPRAYYQLAIGAPPMPFPPVLYERRLYGKPIVQVATPDLSRVDAATAHAYWALYRKVTAGAPALRGDIDVYRDDAAITWVKETCAPGDLHDTMDMTVVPLDAARERHSRRAEGVRVGSACLWQAPLPKYAIAKIFAHRIGALVSDAHLEERRRRYATLANAPPAARSTFDVYLQDGTLFYVKVQCVHADAAPPFFVHVRPTHLGDIPRARRPHGFDALDFRLGGVNPPANDASGDIFDDICMATLDLPDYPIASIATGQYNPGGTGLWRVEFAVADGWIP